VAEKLRELLKLNKEGAIPPDEYAAKRKDLLGRF
jgi:hypothetical protein